MTDPRPALLSLLAAALLVGSAPADSPAPRYNRDVRPILAENCFACHGPDKAARKADLRLDVREDAVKAGAIYPGEAKASPLIVRINTANPKRVMPPPASHKKLTPEQKAVLTRWIDAGAEYEPHWSLLAPRRPALPEVKDARWGRNPIDRFVLARLEKAGLTPAPEADRRALARRVSLDLTGLPPSPADVTAFVRDARPDAYERLVDRLLASPKWGEHRGRYWLDAARYADTHGIHFDNFREMWSYRDWVIGAFNRNQTFDRFTVEQIAGDLLPNRTMDQQIASGFNRCNITTNEGGAIDREYEVLYTRDRTETVAAVWLGMTANCATCHDHKFDPISQREFYSLAAFFNNTTQRAMDGNIKDTPPVITVPLPTDRPRYYALLQELAPARQNVEKQRAAARAEFDKVQADATKSLVRPLPDKGLVFHAPLNEGKGNQLALSVRGQQYDVRWPDGVAWAPGHVSARAFKFGRGRAPQISDVGDFDRDEPFSFSAWLWVPRNRNTGSFFARMDEDNGHRGWDLWTESGRVAVHLIHRWPDNALKVATAASVPPQTWTHVAVTYDGSGKAAGVKIFLNGALQAARVVQADALKDSIRTDVPFKIGQRHKGAPIPGVQVQDLRMYSRAITDDEASRLGRGSRVNWLVTKGKRSPAEDNELFDGWLTSSSKPYQDAVAAVAKLAQEEVAIKARGTVAHVMQERDAPAMANVLFRGDYDKPREQVTPATPRALHPMPANLPRNRLGLAQWLMRDDNPLTARVTVNRFWQELFGTGLVRTSGDFGIAGELPSHPELLDWLAVELRETGWDVKQFFRLLVTSAAYRQAAITTSHKREKDPDNALLSRGPRFRMDAEMIRDNALAASGLLVPALGGPSVKPYQPEGVWEAVAMNVSNTANYRRDSGLALYRRSMYTFWKRSAPPASLEIFNAPARELCTVRRDRTNTPLQALVTLNDDQHVEAARALAELALKHGGKADADRFDYLGERLVARPFRPEEKNVLSGLLADLLAEYRAKPAEAKKLLGVGEKKPDESLDARELAGWTMLVNSLMNLDEVLNK